ncbi:MAG: MFS transporter [Anaerolineales bacterium]|nr:MFS transporter [Anaerolineales bacterium]
MTSSPQPTSTRPWQRLRGIYEEYPRQFWILVLGVFIDRLGGALIFPFFTLYLTSRFGIGMTEVGVIFGMFSISGVIGSMVGGALTDRWGRKGMLIFGLVMSALAHLGMGLVGRIELLYVVVLAVGVLAEMGGPAGQAMVADLLPEEKRAGGFGVLRVVANLAVTIGPVIGGFLATKSYLLLFISDAVASSITALIVFLAIRETHRPRAEGQAQESMAQTFRGYLEVRRDTAFLWFMGASVLMVLVYMQMNTTLAVFLRDAHGVNTQGFGYILSLNALMVVLFQFWITRRVSRYRPLLVMAAGTLLYAIGFAMYGFVSLYWLFLAAMVIITIGEMLVSPVGQAIVARLAPEEMRGRYMAVFGFSWVIPTAVGPLLSGIVMDHFNSLWLWYAAGIIGLAAAAAYYLMEVRVGRARWAAVDRRLNIMQQVEEGKISAQEAAHLLEGVGEGSYARLTPTGPAVERRHLRVRISDLVSGVMKSDLRIPVGLVNTVLYVSGRLSPDLDVERERILRELIARSAAGPGTHQMEAGEERFEVTVE